jgi:hypothetical protein
MKLGIFTVTATLLLAACAQVGTYIEPDKATEVNGIQKAADLMTALGPPSVTVPMGNGKTLWVYIGQLKTVSPDTFIPYLGLLTATERQRCSKFTVQVDDDSGALSDMKYEYTKDTDHWTNVDQNC